MVGGARKAAMLLRSLDAVTAAELLKSAPSEAVMEIATEMAYLDSAGPAGGEDPAAAAREFYTLLAGRSGGRAGRVTEQMLRGALGEQRTREVLDRVQQLVQARDPFQALRSAPVEDIARALEGESPQVAAVVLGELPAQRSGALLKVLPEQVRAGAVRGLTGAEEVSTQARSRVAGVVRARLESFGRAGEPVGPDPARRQGQLRRVAVLLRTLPKELRDALVKAIGEQDQATAGAVLELMVTWDDLPFVLDRPFQEALRGMEARMLALALVQAEPAIAAKVRQNMSERAAAMLEEEASLLASPKPEEIQQARQEVLKVLREMNARGDLSFQEEQAP